MALGKQWSDEGRGGPKMDAPMVGAGENERRPERRSRRSARVRGAFFSEPAGEPEAISLVEIDPMKVLGRKRGR